MAGLSLTRLSSLFATMEANLCSPASSDMRNTYSGAVTWLDLCVLPEGNAKGSQRSIRYQPAVATFCMSTKTCVRAYMRVCVCTVY